MVLVHAGLPLDAFDSTREPIPADSKQIEFDDNDQLHVAVQKVAAVLFGFSGATRPLASSLKSNIRPSLWGRGGPCAPGRKGGDRGPHQCGRLYDYRCSQRSCEHCDCDEAIDLPDSTLDHVDVALTLHSAASDVTQVSRTPCTLFSLCYFLRWDHLNSCAFHLSVTLSHHGLCLVTYPLHLCTFPSPSPRCSAAVSITSCFAVEANSGADGGQYARQGFQTYTRCEMANFTHRHKAKYLFSSLFVCIADLVCQGVQTYVALGPHA